MCFKSYQVILIFSQCESRLCKWYKKTRKDSRPSLEKEEGGMAV